MTPQQEAEYAVAYGSSRSGLSPEAQVLYDQMAADQPSKVETESAFRQALKDAKRGIADNRKVFLVRIPAMYDRVF
jgi:hypothetical protein